MFGNLNSRPPGFTLIELLVVITVINVLASILFTTTVSARKSARISQRVSNLRTLQTALELYNLSNNGLYPNTNNQWWSECTGGGFTPQPKNQWIPGLVDGGFINSLPTDPLMVSASGLSCYVYRSSADAKNYKLMLYQIQEIGRSLEQDDYLKYPQLLDPKRDRDYTRDCTVETTGDSSITAWAIYTPGACSW